jgi:hypothetical protein
MGELERPRQSLGGGQVEDLELAVPHGLLQEPRVLVDHHGAQVELAGLELGELLVHGVGRQRHAQLGQGGQHLARDALGAAPHRPQPDPLAAEPAQRPDLIRIAPEEHQRLGLVEPTDELEPMPGRPLHSVLDEGKVDVARGLAGGQPSNVLHRAGRREIVDSPVLATGLGDQRAHDRVIVAALVPGEEAHAQVGDVGAVVREPDQQRDQTQRPDEERDLQAGRRAERAARQSEDALEPLLWQGRHRVSFTPLLARTPGVTSRMAGPPSPGRLRSPFPDDRAPRRSRRPRRSAPSIRPGRLAGHRDGAARCDPSQGPDTGR